MRIFHIPFIFLVSLAVMLFSMQVQSATEQGDIQGTLSNIKKYIQNIQLDSNYSNIEKVMGKPLQKKALPNNKAFFTAIWKLDKYSVDVKVKNNKVESYGIHWFGVPETIPAFKDIYSGNFESENRKGSEITRQKNDNVIICWTSKPVPGRKEVISVLDVNKNNSQPVCLFSHEIKK